MSPTLVHGDFRMGNLIVEGSTLAAVLDWELAHAGDPREDLAWFCIRAWRFGAAKALDAGGLGSIDDLLAAYEAAGGMHVDRADLRWWLVLTTLRWGVICRYQAQRHLSGESPSVELATIGRRVCETEWDLLNLMEGMRMNLHRPADRGRIGRCRRRFPGRGRPSATEGQVNFHARVAANALRMVQRELENGASPRGRALRWPDSASTDEAELAAAIRRGDLDDRRRGDAAFCAPWCATGWRPPIPATSRSECDPEAVADALFGAIANG